MNPPISNRSWVPYSSVTRRLIAEVGRQRRSALIYLTLLLVGAGLTALRYRLLEGLLDVGLAADGTHAWLMLGMTVGCWLSAQLAVYASALVGLRFERTIASDLVQRCLDRVLDDSMTGYAGIDPNRGVQLLRNGMTKIGRSVRALLETFSQATLLIFTLAAAFMVEPTLGGLSALAAALMLLVASRHLHDQRTASTTAFDAQDRLYARLSRLFEALPQIKLFGARESQLRQLSSPVREQVAAELSALRAQRRASLEMNVVASITGIAIIGLGLVLLQNGWSTIAGLATMLVVHQQIFSGVGKLLTSWASAEENADYLREVVLPAEFSVLEQPRGMTFSEPIHTIECTEASLRVGELTLLAEITCKLQTQRLYGIAGSSGSGKTLLLHLLSGLLLPAEGRVQFNHIQADQLDPRELRKRVALAIWPPLIASASLEENLRLARPDATPEELQEALHMAALDVDVQHLLPMGGLGVMLGREGIQLSVGQMQRLALARAFLRRPEVLLLDDVLTGLDPHTLARVLQSLRSYGEQHLVVLVAQDLAILKQCDEALLVHEGRLVGRHGKDELMNCADWSALMRSVNARAA